jgi:hypothetical protein
MVARSVGSDTCRRRCGAVVADAGTSEGRWSRQVEAVGAFEQAEISATGGSQPRAAQACNLPRAEPSLEGATPMSILH